MEKKKTNTKIIIILIIILLIVALIIAGILILRNRQTANVSSENTIETVKNFENEQEIYDYANNIINSNGYSNLKATMDSTTKTITISSSSITKVIENQNFANISFNIKSPTALVSYVGAQNELQNENKSVLNKDWYSIYITVDIQKHNVSLDTNNWYTNKSIIMNSDKGTYEFEENDTTTIANHDRSSNTGTLSDPRYTMTSKLGYNLYDLNKFNDVISGNDVTITLILSKGIDENGEEKEIKLHFKDNEVLQEIVGFSQNFFSE